MSKRTDLLRATISVDRTYFRKDDFAIITCSIFRLEEDSVEPITGPYGSITIKGTMPILKEDGTLYKVVGEYVNDPKYGDQYNVVSIFPSIEFGDDDPRGQKQFLLSLFTENQVNAMYEALDNPFMALKNKDVQALITVKGCGTVNATSWIDRFHNNLAMAKIFTELEEYELSNTMIEKLMARYKSPELVIEKVKNNPYILATQIKGIGFKTADKIALAGGMQPYSPERIGAFSLYYLEEQGENGMSWITPDQLVGAIVEVLGEDIPEDAIKEGVMSVNEKLWWSEDKTAVGLLEYYNIEHKIAEELLRLRNAESNIKYDNWREQVAELERAQGWEYTEEQIQGIETGLTNNVTIITGLAGCVDCDTEYFNGKEWKKISEYNFTDKVLQYNEDGTAELVTPLAYNKHPKEYLWHFQTKYGIDQCLSEDHNCVIISPKNHIKKNKLSEIMNKCYNKCFYDRFITAFNYEGEGIDLSDDIIRLCVACSADGNFQNHLVHEESPTYNRARFNLTKQRKIDRIIELAKKCNLKYEIRKYNKTKQKDSVEIFIYMPFRFKEFPDEWYKCSHKQKQIICEEVMFWDANSKIKNNYSTVIKKNADFVQFIFASLGYKATISQHDRRGKARIIDNKSYEYKSIEYTVYIAHSPYTGLTCDKREGRINTQFEQYKTKDGFEYCFTVDSGMLILRRNNKIFITGNSGKSSVVKGVLSSLKGYSFVQVALSGRAASRLTEITGKEGATIHRTLGYPKGEPRKQGFEYNDENQLTDQIYILDEISMVDSFLFYYLLRAIPSGSKVYLLGDIGQLESIGAGNIAHDMINSEEITTVFLTKIHRQAAKSAIVTESIKVRRGEQLIEKDWTGTETRGELQDLTIDCYSDKSNTYHRIINTFKHYYEKEDFDVMETQIIVPTKVRGDACTYNLNAAIQKIYNPDEHKASYQAFRDGKTYDLKVGDKVINRVNNYNTAPFIYNGNMGILERFTFDEELESDVMIINFKAIGRVKVPKKYWNNIDLAYAITVHSDQGSEHDNVIFGLDFAAYSLLTRELVYTGITRARKKCELIAQTGALRMAISQEGVNKKQTFLADLLKDLAHPKLVF